MSPAHRRRGRAAPTPEPVRPRAGRSPLRWAALVLGELLVTVGLVVVLFVVWQLWWTNIDADRRQQDAVHSMAQDFGGPTTAAHAVPDRGYGTPQVAREPGYGQSIGIVYVPRFGADYSRPVAEGTGTDVLDTLGLGHYEQKAMPGAVGNFALAGHRQTNGKVLDRIDTLRAGDRIYVRTAQGYYTYRVRSHEIVLPTQKEVLAPVPHHPGQKPHERLLTLTSCSPRFGSTHRYIVYAVMESWQPSSAGPPAAIAHQVAEED